MGGEFSILEWNLRKLNVLTKNLTELSHEILLGENHAKNLTQLSHEVPLGENHPYTNTSFGYVYLKIRFL